MYDFEKHLLANEKILYQGRPVPGKGNKNISGFLFIILFAFLIQFALIWSVVTKTGDGANGINTNFIIIFLVTLIFDALAIYGLIYNLFLKKKNVADDYYCLTNIRALKYESKKDKLVYGYLANYEDIHSSSVKNGYGDVYMGIIYQQTGDSRQDLINIKEKMVNPDPGDMPCLSFESVKSPSQIAKLARNARDELKKLQ